MPVFEAMNHETPEEDLAELRRLAKLAMSAWISHHELLWTSGKDLPPCECVEVGTWMGRTALVLAETFDRVYCVDTWEGNPGDRLGEIAKREGRPTLYRLFLENMGDLLYTKIIPCVGHSWLYSETWPRKVAMVFIDGSHEHVDVYGDIVRWRQNVIPNGIICGHDYGTFEGVTRAVNELIPKAELNLGGRCIWWTTAR
jgi:hypothetical protein